MSEETPGALETSANVDTTVDNRRNGDNLLGLSSTQAPTSSEKRQATIMLSNVRGLLSKRDELQVWVNTHAPAMVALSETWLTPEIADSEVALQGYNLFRADRTGGRIGGGVALYTREVLPVTMLEVRVDPDGYAESLWCRVKMVGNGYDTVGVIYRSPRSNPPIIMDAIRKWAQNGHCLVLGDFNAPHINWDEDCSGPLADPFSRELHITIGELALHQHAREPTRLQGSQSSTLDLVISPRLSDIEKIDYLPPLGSSDHSVLAVHWRRGVPLNTTPQNGRNVWRIPFDAMRASANSITWLPTPPTHVDDAWQRIRDGIIGLINAFAPARSPCSHAKGPPWFDRELRACLRRRNRCWKNYRATGEHYEKYKELRNRCTTLKVAKRCKYEERLAVESATAPKRLYAYLKRRTRTSTGIPSIVFSGTEAETPTEKAAAFARHYASVYESETLLNTLSSPFDMGVIEQEEVARELRILNTQKSAGPDGIHPLVLRELADVLAPPLTQLFNLSLQSGALPQEWKKAIICPMYKGGSRKLTGSYRPVSLTCIAGKVMERLITGKLRSHLEDHGLLHPSQHGFRPKRSCNSNLLLAREQWAKVKAQGHVADVVFVDFAKAFDKVPHERLLEKLKAFGVNGTLFLWIEDFLKGRTFSVRIAQSLSQWLHATSGVPQGSVLGPLLFLMYINDLPAVLKSPCLVYADDLKIWRVIHSEEDQKALQDDLDALAHWATKWTLPINLSKCVHMHIGSGVPAAVYRVHETPLHVSNCETDLGVMVCSSLKTRLNTDRVCAKARSILGAIRRSFGRLSKVAFKTLYASHVRTRLEYGGAAAYPCTKAESEKLERTQRYATRLVNGLRGVTYEGRLDALGLFPERYRRIRGDILCLRKILRGDLGPEIQSEFPLRNCSRTRGHALTLKKQQSIGLPLVYRLSRRVTNIWNKLPASVAEEENDANFKRRLDKYLEHLWRTGQP